MADNNANNEIRIESLKQELYNSDGFSDRAKWSLETILKCFKDNVGKSSYTSCIYSYQNIIDYLDKGTFSSKIREIIKEYGYSILFEANVYYARKDKKQLRNPSYSPGYAPADSVLNKHNRIVSYNFICYCIKIKQQFTALFERIIGKKNN